MRAGLPATTAYGGTDSTTTAPAPTIAPRPMVIPGSSVALAPIDAPSFTIVVRNFVGRRLLRGKRSFANVAFGTDEDVVLDAHAVPELDAAFHRDAIADDDVVLDERVVADVAVGADARPGQHVRERPDARARADVLRFAHRLRMQKRARQRACALARRGALICAPPRCGLLVDSALRRSRGTVAFPERESPAHDRERAGLGVLERPPRVRADDREPERIERAEARDQQHGRRVARARR